MSRWFEVRVRASKTVLVEVPDGWKPDRERVDLAQEYASKEAFPNARNVEVLGGNTIELVTHKQIEAGKRHADEVLGA